MCLFREPLLPPIEIAAHVAGLQGDAAVGGAGGDVGGQVFLDSDGLVQVVVKAQIGHAKAAHAQYAHQFVFLQLISLEARR